MKKLFPAFLVLFLIPIAFACKKGTNSTGTVTNGVARVELTFSPAIPSATTTFYLDILTRTATSGYVGSIAMPIGSTKYTSDDYSVTEGQNFTYYVSTTSSSPCYSVTGKIFYNNVLISTKNLVIGFGACKDGGSSSHNAICK